MTESKDGIKTHEFWKNFQENWWDLNT